MNSQSGLPLFWKATAVSATCFYDNQCRDMAEKHLRSELPEGSVVVETGSNNFIVGEGVVQLWVTYRSGDE